MLEPEKIKNLIINGHDFMKLSNDVSEYRITRDNKILFCEECKSYYAFYNGTKDKHYLIKKEVIVSTPEGSIVEEKIFYDFMISKNNSIPICGSYLNYSDIRPNPMDIKFELIGNNNHLRNHHVEQDQDAMRVFIEKDIFDIIEEKIKS